MLCYQFAIGLVNDLADLDEDRRAKPWKPLARGTIRPPAAVVVAVTLVMLGLSVTAIAEWRPWLIGVAGLGLGLSYDLWLKRTVLSWAPYALAIPLIPLWVLDAAGRTSAGTWIVVPLGALLGIALHLANQAPDVDDGHGPGLPDILGGRTSRAISLVLYTAVAGVAGAILLTRGDVTPGWTVLGLGLASAVGTPLAQGLGRDHLFEVLAVGSGVIAVLFLQSLAMP